jgi:hypothetical protein
MTLHDNAIIARVLQLQIGLNEVSVKQSMLNSELTKLVGDILRRSTVADAPSPMQAITRALQKDGFDSAGAIGARERGFLEAGSEQTPTVATQGRNEPASVEAAAGAMAGEGDEGSEPPPAPRDLKRDRILDLWATGMSKEAIAEATGSTPISVNTTVVVARRYGEPRAVRRTEAFEQRRERILDLYSKGNLPAAIAREMGTPLKGIETVLYRARKAGEPRAAKHKPTTPRITEFAGKGRGGDGESVQTAAGACGNASMPSPAKPTAHDAANERQRAIARDFLAKRAALIEPKPRIMPTKEVVELLAGEVAARGAKSAPTPYSDPLEPTEAKPIPAAELPAPVPAIKLDPEIIMFVADGVVHGPDGIEERLTTQQLLILTRMADGGMYPEKVLSDISGTDAREMLVAMRAKMAAIGVEVFETPKGFWRARRSGE